MTTQIIELGWAQRRGRAVAPVSDGAAVTTVEGLEEGALARAFIEAGAAQCGFCTSGFLVSAAALLRDGRRRTREELRELLGGNLCRCTGYGPIVEAVLRCQP